jgi:prepilin-type N-terminal cleavage/methylation domain-containing protein
MRRTDSGFTLVELMIVVVVLAVLSVIAIPNFQRMIDKNRLRDATGPFFTGLSLARSEAIKLGDTVDVCTGTGVACNFTSSWDTHGWVVIENATGTTVRTQAAAHSKVNVGGSAVKRIRYLPSGLVSFNTSSSTTVTNTQTFNWASDCWTQDVTINPTGSVSITTPDFSGC